MLLAVLTVVFASAAVVLAVNRSGGSTRTRTGVDPPARIGNVGAAPRFDLNGRSRIARELVAMRRLASYGLPVYCGGRRGRMIALTFDDGPGEYTRLAVRKLRHAHVAATFFLVGKQVVAYPRLAGLERSLGPLGWWGDHTMTHPFLPALPRDEMVREITAARTLIERAERVPVVLFRPPYGGRTRAIDAEVRRLGMVEVLWNVDSADSLGANYAEIERNVIAGLRPGSIILMHENRGQTIRGLPRIFAAIRRRRLQPVTVAQLLTNDPPTPRQLHRGEPGCAISLRHGNGA